jgi:hypothetical protein
MVSRCSGLQDHARFSERQLNLRMDSLCEDLRQRFRGVNDRLSELPPWAKEAVNLKK